MDEKIVRPYKLMKDQIKRGFWRSLILFSSLISNKKRGEGTLIIPPTSSGSIGDEAVLRGILEMCKVEKTAATILTWNKDDYEHLNASLIDGSMFFHGSSYKMFFRIRNVLKRYACLVVAGTDMMDGFYDDWIPNKLIDLAEIAETCCARSSIFGFSVADPTRPTIQRLSCTRVTSVVRDPVSYERLLSVANSKTRLFLGADCSIWIEPITTKRTEEILSRISSKYIVLNISPPCIHSNSSDSVVQSICAATADFCKNNNSDVIVLPHHFQRRENDLTVCTKAADHLKALGVRAHLIDYQLDARESKHLVSQSDFLVTGRMHLALAACSTAKPSICFPYMGKFKGLFQLYSIPEKYILPIHSMDSKLTKNLKHAMDMIQAESNDLRQILNEKHDVLKSDLLELFSNDSPFTNTMEFKNRNPN